MPVIAVAAAAPAASASAECNPQALTAISTSWAMTGGLANWLPTRSPANSPAVNFSASYGAMSPNIPALQNVALLEADPPSASPTSSVITTRSSGCLGPGTYDFTFVSQSYIDHLRNLTLTARVRDANSNAVLASTSFTTVPTHVRRSTYTLRITVAKRTQVKFEYAFTFGQFGASNVGDDIGVTTPTITGSSRLRV